MGRLLELGLLALVAALYLFALGTAIRKGTVRWRHYAALLPTALMVLAAVNVGLRSPLLGWLVLVPALVLGAVTFLTMAARGQRPADLTSDA